MVNFGLNSASLLGLFLLGTSIILYVRLASNQNLKRNTDFLLLIAFLICGLILLFQGWRLDPILQFGQFLLTAVAIFYAVEEISLRR